MGVCMFVSVCMYICMYFMHEKILDFIPGKYGPRRKQILAQISGNICFVYLTYMKAYGAVQLNQITTVGFSNIK